MRWDDERFVKVYTRDTPDWLALGWEAHALFWELLRKSDRAGLFEVGKSGARGVAAVTGIPSEVVERALPILLEDGCIESHGAYLLVRNFIEAQSANQSDKARAAKSRESARDSARRNTVVASHSVTAVANQSRNGVTECDSNTENVTPRLEDTRLARTEGPEERCSLARDPSASTTEQVAQTERKIPTGYSLLFMFGRLRGEILGVQEAPGAGVPKDSNGKASSFAEKLTEAEAKDVEATMRMALARIRDRADGWSDDRNAGTNFGFGSWASKFDDLREELHGGAPKLKPKPCQHPERADGSRNGPKPFRWPELKVPQSRKVATP